MESLVFKIITDIFYINSYQRKWLRKGLKFQYYIINDVFNLLWNNALDDKLNIFNTTGFKDFKKSNLSNKEKDAFDILELNYSAKWQEIQQKFKYLVKKYHPDKNQGSKKFEDKLKKITLAYSQLKKTLGKK